MLFRPRLSSDEKRTPFINLDCDNLKPKGWDDMADEKPELPSLTDISIFEFHIRDFSANDRTVDPDHQGGYLAFTYQVMTVLFAFFCSVKIKIY
ncbi:Pullulanase 1 [Ranunculus cassubicifolius]